MSKKQYSEDGHVFYVETPEEVEAIVKEYEAEYKEFQGGDENPSHICHVKSPYGYLYFYTTTPEIARDIWEHWFPEDKEARLQAEDEARLQDEYEQAAWANYEKELCGGQG